MLGLIKQTVFCGLFLILIGFSFTSCRRAKSPIVAKVGTAAITADELRARLTDVPSTYRQYAATPEGRQQFLKLLVREKVLLLEAKNLGVPRDKAYKAAVAKYQSEAETRLRDYKNTLLVESALQRLRSRELAATDADVQRYYDTHAAEYQKPVEVTASHILLASEKDAELALARLKAKEPFERVAREMSKDPATAVRGGKLSAFRRGMLVPEFEDAAFGMKSGELSGIVKSQFGFHIIKKLGEKVLPARPLSQVKDEIRTKIEREKFDQWVAAKEALLGVRINNETVSSLSLEETPTP